jgi:TRAP-type uncharacterized transport system substrate-binding protein
MLGFSRLQLLKASAAVAAVVGMVSLALIYFFPAPPSTVTIAVAFKGSSAEHYGRRYSEIFERANIRLEVRTTDGAEENIRLLRDPKAGVQIAMVLGGAANGQSVPGVMSLGTIFNNPFWIFYSSSLEPLSRLSELKGKRIAVGPLGSATRSAAEQILGKAGVNATTATFLPLVTTAAMAALDDGRVDVAWSAGTPEGEAVRALLQNPRARLMSFPMAEGVARNFPNLVRLTLPQGTIDLDRVIPPNDVVLIGTTAKILVRDDLHPRIVELLLQAMVEAHGGPNVFQHVGEFPNGIDTEFPVAPAAIDFYKSGPSFLQRHLPLWLSAHAQRAIAVLVAGIAIGVPLFRFLPAIYQWISRRRLIYWYGKLKALEASFDSDPNDKHLPEKKIEIERIEDAVSHIQMPLSFTDQLYNLRSHIDIVRRKIASRTSSP